MVLFFGWSKVICRAEGDIREMCGSDTSQNGDLTYVVLKAKVIVNCLD